MKKLLFLLPMLLVSSICMAQNLDSLYDGFISLKSRPAGRMPVISSKDAVKYKCGFGLAADVRTNFDKFTTAQRSVIAAYLSRPLTDSSFVSPAGYFRIHFNPKGDSKPSFNVDEFAAAADSAYNIEVGVMGFPPPPGDSGAGGDDRFDIYIINISGYYGYTELETKLNDNSYTSYMVMDNDFLGNYTTGIKAAKVTVAHEFHHAIQVGNYPYRSSDKYYHELTSTSMEEFVFDYVNDYYFYQSGYFDYPSQTISFHSGYDMAIFNLFLKERFGITLIKRIWEFITGNRALKAISLAIEESNSTFKNEFSKFNTWTFFTGYRAVQGKYFKEAKFYPLLKPSMTLEYATSSRSLTSQTEPISNNPFLFVNRALSVPDSIYAIVTNGDYANGYLDPYALLQCSYTISSAAFTGARQIGTGYYVKLESPTTDLLNDVNVINNVLIDENTTFPAVEITDPFPQPFNYSRHSTVAIPAAKGESVESLLYIYTLNMKQVYSGSLRVYSTDKIYVRWNGMDDNSNRLPNGVYFYVTKRDGSILKGKVVIQND